jgi:beta-galactosidase
LKTEELGLRFSLPSEISYVEWERKGQWTNYPDDHIGRLSGKALKDSPYKVRFREKPSWSWSEDTQNHYLNGIDESYGIFYPATNDFKAMKEHIYWYKAGIVGKTPHVTVSGNADISARMEPLKTGEMFLVIDQQWSYPLDWGNDNGEASLKGNFKGKINLQIVD